MQAVLLVGFSQEEVQGVRDMFEAMEATMFEVRGGVGSALHTRHGLHWLLHDSHHGQRCWG